MILKFQKHLTPSPIMNCLSNYTSWDSKVNYCLYVLKITLPTEIKKCTSTTLCQSQSQSSQDSHKEASLALYVAICICSSLLILHECPSIPSSISNTDTLLFVDDTKCFCNVSHPCDITLLQNDLNSVMFWSQAWGFNFNSSCKSIAIHLSFRSKINSTYYISGSLMRLQFSHQNLYHHLTFLGTIITTIIIPKSYISKILGLLRRYFSKFHSSSYYQETLNSSFIKSQITYCSMI